MIRFAPDDFRDVSFALSYRHEPAARFNNQLPRRVENSRKSRAERAPTTATRLSRLTQLREIEATIGSARQDEFAAAEAQNGAIRARPRQTA